ncbi:MAG: hypothetical protein RLN90_01550 [Balneolaceae bacterium]
MSQEAHQKYSAAVGKYFEDYPKHINGVETVSEINIRFKLYCKTLVTIGLEESNTFYTQAKEECEKNFITYNLRTKKWEDYFEIFNRLHIKNNREDYYHPRSNEIQNILNQELHDDRAVYFCGIEIMNQNINTIEANNEWWELQLFKHLLAIEYVRSELDVEAYISSLENVKIINTDLVVDKYITNKQVDNNDEKNQNFLENRLKRVLESNNHIIPIKLAFFGIVKSSGNYIRDEIALKEANKIHLKLNHRLLYNSKNSLHSLKSAHLKHNRDEKLKEIEQIINDSKDTT